MRPPVIDLIDDDPAVLRAISRLLRAHGLFVTTFSSGADFLKTIEDSHDCIILDVQMPEMGGFELSAKLRSLGCKAPIIYITAHEDSKAEHLALSNGATAFLYKPVRAETLCAAIRNALKQGDTSAPD
jgi:FixJ family two-component response regulator